MQNQYTLQSAGNSTRGANPTLLEFLSWPLEQRKRFVEQHLAGIPIFAKEPLLRAH